MATPGALGISTVSNDGDKLTSATTHFTTFAVMAEVAELDQKIYLPVIRN